MYDLLSRANQRGIWTTTSRCVTVSVCLSVCLLIAGHSTTAESAIKTSAMSNTSRSAAARHASFVYDVLWTKCYWFRLRITCLCCRRKAGLWQKYAESIKCSVHWINFYWFIRGMGNVFQQFRRISLQSVDAVFRSRTMNNHHPVFFTLLAFHWWFIFPVVQAQCSYGWHAALTCPTGIRHRILWNGSLAFKLYIASPK